MVKPESIPQPLQRRLLAISLALCLLYLVLTTWTWPFVGDASYIHYIVFLTHHGFHPYRDIVDMNLPGTYLVDQAVLATLGPTALAWRIFDLLLMAALVAASISLFAEPGLFAATLFLAIHAQDGVQMLAERDLQVAVALLCTLALLVDLHRNPTRRPTLKTLLAASLSALAISIKPTAALTVLALAAWLSWQRPRDRRPTLLFLLGITALLLIPLAYLLHEHALPAFLTTLTGPVRYHASLDPRPLTYLLPHSLSPILPLAIPWLLLRLTALAQRTPTPAKPPSKTSLALILCVATALLSYLLQRKGFSYQRYPFLAFFLLVLLRDLFRHRSTRLQQALSTLGLASAFIMAILFTHRASTYSHTPANQQLIADLATYGGPALNRSIQCMDTAGGCIAALNQAQIIQSTGFLYDCYLLDPTHPVAQALRQRFWQALTAAPPRAIIVTDSVCYDQPRSFEKYAHWPEFEAYLTEHYTLAQQRTNLSPEHYWSRTTTPFDYRIYLRR